MVLNTCPEEWPDELSGPFTEDQIDDTIEYCLPKIMRIVESNYADYLQKNVSYNSWDIVSIVDRLTA